MNNYSLDLSPAAKLSSRRLAFNLVIRDGRIGVRACEITSHSFRNRTSFPEICAIETVIVERIAQAIRSVVEGLPPSGAHVLSIPEFLVELPGLVLSGAHVLVTDVQDGARNAIFRFKEFLGAINFAFLTDIGFEQSITDHNERLATNILADLCMPLLNLCRHSQFTRQIDPGGDVARQIADKASELEFRTELLKRFVSHSGEAGDAGLALKLARVPRPMAGLTSA
ncbi:hypothetical protein R5H30_06555 [Sulfitobacter sp. D35]|uniref:hypothetical protein n=1 Tax=Sulfitobacter sp. D35 TaxID=3083252 RepID=UPI00296E54CA|nr:hypothetical protein [Sulfitobacter sp. D35]MDW4497636.1 hypothetical protein [Sulfitobacter sp. D35]